MIDINKFSKQFKSKEQKFLEEMGEPIIKLMTVEEAEKERQKEAAKAKADREKKKAEAERKQKEREEAIIEQARRLGLWQ